MADTLTELGQVCEHLRPGEPAEGVLGVIPAYVAAPATVAEAAEVMRVAAERGLTVVPRGGETRLDWGAPPHSCDLLLDTWRLDRVVEHAAGDLIVKVEAGMRRDRLAAVLAEQGQQLALDVPLAGSTVGGTLATAAAGPRRLHYGSARDLLIGITIVRADGTIAKAGGKVVKNVAGYDLGKLFTGSYGTLGLIVEAAFRLHPIPTARAYLSRDFTDAASAHAAMRAVAHSAAVPSAIELDAPADQTTVTLAVLIEGVAEGIPARSAQITELLGPDTRIDPDAPDWWGRYPDGSTLIEFTALPTGLDAVDVLAGRASVRLSANGRGHVAVAGGTPAEETAAALNELRAALARRGGGSAVVRYAPEEVRERVDLWGAVPALSLMRRVKDQFDPEHRLSPGRFVGGI